MSELTKSEKKIKDFLDANFHRKFILSEIANKNWFSVDYTRAVLFDLRDASLIVTERKSMTTEYFSRKYKDPVQPIGEVVKISHASKFKSKPYRTDRAMQESIARCRELYPEGHSLSKSGNKS